MLRLSFIQDNAMLFKDVTQWLRRRTFLMLFLGLLSLAQVVSFIIIMIPLPAGRAGPAAFTILSGILFLYLIVICFMTHGAVSKEFSNRTFELFELSGMSLEKMIRGKYLSALAEFFFGFFAIIPFMVFAYQLGGLDFYLILVMILLVFLFAPPLCLLALTIGLLGNKKGIATLAKIVGALLGLFLGGYAFVIVIAMLSSPAYFFRDLIQALQQIFELNWDAIVGLTIFFVFYVQVLFFLFYICCQAICPATDSRQSQIKLFVFLFMLSWLLLGSLNMIATPYGKTTVMYINCLVALISICLVGLIGLYGRRDVPIMAMLQSQRAGRTRRAFMSVFTPGSEGTVKTVGFMLLTVLFFAALVGCFGNPRARSYFAFLSIPLQAPWFLGFPAFFLMTNKRIRRGRRTVAPTVLILWVVLGVVAILFESSVAGRGRHYFRMESQIAILFSTVVSPFSTGLFRNSGSNYLFWVPWARVILGGWGVYLMIGILRLTPIVRVAPIAVEASGEMEDFERMVASEEAKDVEKTEGAEAKPLENPNSEDVISSESVN